MYFQHALITNSINTNSMNKIICFLFCLLCSLSFSSCKDDIDIDEQENTITYKVFANEDEYISVSDIRDEKGNTVNGLLVKSGWEHTIKTKEWDVYIILRCENPKTLLTVEIYKNKKLIDRKEGNSYLNLHKQIKSR